MPCGHGHPAVRGDNGTGARADRVRGAEGCGLKFSDQICQHNDVAYAVQNDVWISALGAGDEEARRAEELRSCLAQAPTCQAAPFECGGSGQGV